MKRLLTFTATSDSKIEVRHYEINPGSKINETEVKQKVLKFNEIGPHFDLTLRREKLASTDLFKTACKQPKLEKPETKRNKKNLYTDELGQKMGKVFFQRQDLKSLELRKYKKKAGIGKNNKARFVPTVSQEQRRDIAKILTDFSSAREKLLPDIYVEK